MARRGFMSSVGVVIQGVVRFITNALIGRLGGPAVLGSVASAISTAQLLALLWPTTSGSAASKFIARARGKEDPAETAAIAAHLARRTIQATFALAGLAIPIWTLVYDDGVVEASIVAALVTGYSGYSFTRGLKFGAGQVPSATRWDVATAALGAAGVVALLGFGVRGLALVLPLAAANILFTVGGWPWGARGQLVSSLRREIDGFVALGVLGTVASSGFLHLSVIVARVGGGAASAGQYAAALVLATPPSLLAVSLSLVLFPSMSEAWGRGDAETLYRQTDLSFRVLIVTMTAIIGSLALCSRLLVATVWGHEYDRTATLLPILLLAVLANTIGVACSNSLTTRSHRGMVASTGASVCGMVVGMIAWALLAPKWGPVGVALGYLAGSTVIAAIPIAIVWRRERHPWKGLALRLAAGLVLLVALLAMERTVDPPVAFGPVIALLFLGSWVSIMRTDVKLLLGVARRRQV